MEFEHYNGKWLGPNIFDPEYRHLFCIYKLTLRSTGMSYIGQTLSTKDRFDLHCSSGSGCRFISNAIQKHGWESFDVIILQKDLLLDEANDIEGKLIKEYNTLAPYGYNLKTGGNNIIFSKESNRKKSRTMKNVWSTSEYQNNWYRATWLNLIFINNWLKTRWSQENRKKQSEKYKQLWTNEDYRNSMSQKFQNLWLDAIYRQKHLSSLKKKWEDNKEERLKKTWKNEDFKIRHAESMRLVYHGPGKEDKRRWMLMKRLGNKMRIFIETYDKHDGIKSKIMRDLNMSDRIYSDRKKQMKNMYFL